MLLVCIELQSVAVAEPTRESVTIAERRAAAAVRRTSEQLDPRVLGRESLEFDARGLRAAIVDDEQRQTVRRKTLDDIRNRVAVIEHARDFPMLVRHRRSTLSDVLDAHIEDDRAKAVLATLWPYLGLPPSKLSFHYFAMMLMSYVEGGAWYCRGSF